MIRRTWTIAALAAGVTLALAVPAGAQSDAGTVVVAGEATITRAPDVAHVVFAVEARDRDPRAAQGSAAGTMVAVQAALRRAGLGEDALRTLSYGLEPEYDFVKDRRELRGYVARNRIEARVDAIARVGTVIDAAVGAGATSVDGLSFDLKDRRAVEREALKAAAADAWARAQAAASGVGRTVDRVLRIEEPGAGPSPRPQPMLAMRAGSPTGAQPPPISAGSVEITARVTLTALLK
jgi:hypothetical protein